MAVIAPSDGVEVADPREDCLRERSEDLLADGALPPDGSIGAVHQAQWIPGENADGWGREHLQEEAMKTGETKPMNGSRILH
jgi:hypothetical protein